MPITGITGPAHAEDLLSVLRSGEAAPEIRRFAARGVLPLESNDRMRALFAVLKDPDPDIATAARSTLEEFPPDAFADFLKSERATPAEIDTVASLTDDVLVLEQVVRHRSVSDSTLMALARTVAGTPQEALIVNQARLLQNPALIDALYANPALTADGRRMLNELKEEFFEKEARRRVAREAAVKARSAEEARPAAAVPAAAPGELDAGDGDEADSAGEAPDGDAADTGAVHGAEELYLRLMKLTVPEKVKLALRGGKEERRFLIADSSRMVALAVLRSRGLTFTEVESFCSMRHIDDEIFYQISRKRVWMRRPGVVMAMVKNPKVPFAITLPLLARLPMRELRNLARNRNLPEAIRITAKRTYLARRK